MNLDRKKVIISIVFAAIIVGSSFAISFDFLEKKTNIVSGNGPALSNITVDLSISPHVTSTAASGTASPNFIGALIEIWPIYHPVDKGESYEIVTNVSPMVTLWTNNTWNASFRLPAYFISVDNDWKAYFVNVRGGSTSMIAITSYLASNGSSQDTAYTYTTALPCNPSSVHNGSIMRFNFHPDLSSAPHMNVPANESRHFGSPAYSNSAPLSGGLPSSGNSTGTLYAPDHVPYPGGNSSYWTWELVKEWDFIDGEIPVSYLNATEMGLGVMVEDSLSVGTTTQSVNFSMAKGYDISGMRSYSMGSKSVYSSGIVAGGDTVQTRYGSDLTAYDGVIAINGNATIWQYRWVDYGPNANIIAKSNNYSTDASITSLNQSGHQFHMTSYYAGYENLNNYTSYNQTDFKKDFSATSRYQLAFGTYFNGSNSAALWGNTAQVSDIGTLASNAKMQWSEIYSSIGVTTSNIEASFITGMSILIGLAGVALAMGAIPFSDSVTIPALLVALVGFGATIASAFASGVISVTGSSAIWNGWIQNAGTTNSPTAGNTVAVYNWYTPATIKVNGVAYRFPTNYAIIEST